MPCRECGTRPAGGQRRPGLRSVTRSAVGGRPQGSPLRRGYKECDAGRNPPVTASPCQPPLGKGAEGTGDADCHTSDIGHWFAMTGGFTRGAVQAGKFAFYFSRKNKHRPDCCQGRCFAPWYPLASPPAHAKRPHGVPLHSCAVTGAPVRI